MYVEVYNPRTNICSYVAYVDGKPVLRDYDPSVIEDLAKFAPELPVGGLFDLIRPMIQEKMDRTGNDEPVIVRIFTLTNDIRSLTRTSARIVGEYVTGYNNIVDGFRLPLTFHPTATW